MNERSIPVTSIVKLGDRVLAQEKTPVIPPPWPVVVIAGLLLVGVAFWAAAGD